LDIKTERSLGSYIRQKRFINRHKPIVPKSGKARAVTFVCLAAGCNADTLSNVTHVPANAGYAGAWFEHQVRHILGAEVQIAKRSELDKFIERSFA
jgi:hypothetical protein